MTWDLSQMVEFDDPGFIEERLTAVVKAAEEFREKYRGKIESFGPKEVFEMYEALNNLELQFEGPINYSRLAYAANMNDEIAKRLYDRFRNAYALLMQAVAFMDLELGALLTKNPEIINDSVLTEYKHSLEKIQRRIPHMLTELEEQVIIAKDKNGIRAWSMLQ
ncbi:MAG: M3 family oligoendopeptidase, partial [Candidatus Thorarchaeota archaeon]